MAYLLSYTRQPINEVLYDPKLAYSMHLALSEDGISFIPLNHNSGVLFAKAVNMEDGSLEARCMLRPVLFQQKDGSYGVVAELTDDQGKGFVPATMGIYETKDFIRYTERTEFQGKDANYQDFMNIVADTLLPDTIPAIEGIVPVNMIEITESEADYLKKKLLTPVNIKMQVPETITVSSPQELTQIRAIAEYSDGTSAAKRVDWDLSGVDFEKEGTYQITGQIHQDHYDFPIAFDRADPCVGKWQDKYYFIATNDADQNHTLYIREADSIPELVNAEEHLILDSDTYEDIGNLLWAPEFHIIQGKLCILHAATPDPFFQEESHIMVLREGGNPCCREDWSRPRRVTKADGSEICEAGRVITLDMTCFDWENETYAVWSQREFLPKDLGAWLYIAKLNSAEPWKLDSEPVVLSKPDYSWGNNHTFVEEGPFALIRNDKLFVSFSAAAVDTSYVVGLLSIEPGKDPLVPANWEKKGYPILTSRSVEGEYGTGHNAYVTDEYGDVWNTYHGRPGTDAPRSSGIRRVHFDIEGEPILDMTEALDVAPELREVSAKLVITRSK